MKIRQDFVTNSSSSSFILAYSSKEDAVEKITKSLSYNPEAMGIVIRDVMNATPMTPEYLEERLMEEAQSKAYWDLTMGEGGWWSSRKPTFENLWMKAHPGASHRDMRESPEWKEAEKKIIDDFMKEAKAKFNGKDFIVEISYSDNDGQLYSELEHDIMGDVEGVEESFSHH